MLNPTLRRAALLAGVFLVIAIAIAYFLHKHLRARNNAPMPGGAIHLTNPTAGTGQVPANIQRGRGAIPKISNSRARQILEEWLASFDSNQPAPNAPSFIELTGIIHRAGSENDWLYTRARQILMDPSLSHESKLKLISALTQSATPEAVQLFTDLSRTNLPEDLREAIIYAISQVGDYYWDKSSLPEVAVPIMNLWRETKDPQLLGALATALGRIGNENAINYLFDSVLNQGTTLAEIQKSTDPKAVAALSVLDRLTNPMVVPTIEARLSSSNNTAETVICAKILASVGQGEAIQYFLAWIKNAGDSYAPFVADMLAYLPSTGREYLNVAMAQDTIFKSNQVKQAVLKVVGNP